MVEIVGGAVRGKSVPWVGRDATKLATGSVVSGEDNGYFVGDPELANCFISAPAIH